MTPPESSGERTEKATPKKRRDAREKGQVLKSNDVNVAVNMVAMFFTISVMGGVLLIEMRRVFIRYLGGDGSGAYAETFGVPYLTKLFTELIWQFFSMALPFLAVAFIVGIAINIAQVGFLFTTKTISPKFSKINPIAGFKRIFSMKSLEELVKAVLKISIVGYVVYSEFMHRFNTIPNLMNLGVMQSVELIADMCMSVAFKAALALAGIGLADYLFQWWNYEKELKMTKQEVKDEYKLIEGDPKIKGRIKQKQREMSHMRMMQAIPQADVVITNPTHYAIALRYDEKQDKAPVVLAKGKDLVAQRIKEKAAEAKIEMVENRPLARALYIAAEVGQQIPEELFQAVAEILAYIFSKRRK